MKKNTKKYYTTVILVWAGCAIILSFAYMIVLVPQRQQRKAIAERLQRQIRAFEEAEKANKQETQDKFAAELETLKLGLKDYVVDFADSANLTFDISEIAAQHQMDAFSIRTQENRATTKLADLQYIDEDYFDVSLVADFNKFAMFLNALERHDPTLLVDEFSITRSKELTAEHQAKLNLAVLVRKKD
ncbi:MAG: GspMb/PilO family protein [Planctomycetota bacterium]|jgi:hypothetical protein